uniref:Uncharacterized protein n=1 Tax=Arion vulgaris TaxID=1028688 RepID=A0A0B7ABJ6_9EUPU
MHSLKETLLLIIIINNLIHFILNVYTGGSGINAIENGRNGSQKVTACRSSNR